MLIMNNPKNEFWFCRILFELSKEYETEIFQIQRDIQKFREENEELKKKLNEIFKKDEQDEQEHEPDAISDFKNNYIYFTDEIFNNFRNQLQLLCQVSHGNFKISLL